MCNFFLSKTSVEDFIASVKNFIVSVEAHFPPQKPLNLSGKPRLLHTSRKIH